MMLSSNKVVKIASSRCRVPILWPCAYRGRAGAQYLALLRLKVTAVALVQIPEISMTDQCFNALLHWGQWLLAVCAGLASLLKALVEMARIER